MMIFSLFKPNYLFYKTLSPPRIPINILSRPISNKNGAMKQFKNLRDEYDWSVVWFDKIAGSSLSHGERKNLLKYLLPSGLFAKDARPFLAKPSTYRPHRSSYIQNGVPCHSGYFMKFPKFQQHLYKALYIFSKPIDPNQTGIKLKFEFDTKAFMKYIRERVPQKDIEAFITLVMAIYDRPDSAKFTNYLKIYRYKERKHNVKRVNSKSEKEEMNEYRAMGRRKTSIADVVLKPGDMKILVNGLDYCKYFPNPMNRQSVLAPLYEVENLNFDVDANVIGGGHSGQAGAIRNAISLCLMEYNPKWTKTLNQPGYAIKDYRIVERKKYARHKARKRYKWVPR